MAGMPTGSRRMAGVPTGSRRMAGVFNWQQENDRDVQLAAGEWQGCSNGTRGMTGFSTGSRGMTGFSTDSKGMAGMKNWQ
jgi:hypothetical protein